jgi:hypothetical protein
MMRTERLGPALLWLICQGLPSVAFGIEAPPWHGPASLENQFRKDWYACYSESEKTVPTMSVQASGEHGVYAVYAAMKGREKQVYNLAVACIQARGYTWGDSAATPSQAAPVPGLADPRGPKGK